MTLVESLFFWATVFTYLAAFFVHLFSFVQKKTGGHRFAMYLAWTALVCHTGTVAAWWLIAGHAPVTGTYELNLTCTWVTVLILLVFDAVRRIPRVVAITILPIVFLQLGHGLITRSDITPIGPAFQSPWLIVHVAFAWLSFGCFAVAAGSAMLLLLRERSPSRKLCGRLPDSVALDLSSYRFVVLGFINLTLMLASGSIWAKKLWGHYWSWSPLEAWSLLTFLLYAFYLHARAFLGWKMRRAAWLAAFGLIALSISFWGVGWFAPSIHPGP